MLNRRTTAVLLLSFASGLPLVLVGSTLQAWYTEAGVSLFGIGLLSLIGQPYVYKFLWAPFLDRFTWGHLDRRRSWILLTQGFISIGLIIMAFLPPQTHALSLAAIAFGVAFFSATQDIAFDAYRTDLLPVEERGEGSAMNNVGYRVAMLVAGAIGLVLAAKIGWQALYLLMAGLMLLEMGFTLVAPPIIHEPIPKHLKSAVIEPFKNFLTRDNAVLILFFIAIYKLSDALSVSLNTPFLLRGLGFSLIELGAMTKILGLLGALLGSIVGGFYLGKLGIYRSLLYFGFLQLMSNLLFALLAVVGKNYLLMGTAVFSEYFCGGLSSVAMVVFLMGLCDQRYTATQYALFSAISAVGRIVAGPEAAILVDHLGWTSFYIWTSILGLPALLLLVYLKQKQVFGTFQ